MTILQKIQSLITAANNTTGESDTTLTNAVQTLIDGYGQGGGATALYPFAYSYFHGTSIEKTVTDGSHIKIKSSGTGTVTVNVPHSLPSVISNRSFASSYQPYPIIPAGTEVTVALKNVSENVTGYAVGTTKPGGTIDMNSAPLGKDGGSIGGTNNRKSYTYTATEAVQISSFYVVFVGSSNADIEFDFELTVGGVRWI